MFQGVFILQKSNQQTEVKLLFRNMQLYMVRKKGSAYRHENIILSVRYSGGGIMIWGNFAS